MANPRLLIEHQTLSVGAMIALDEGQARHVGTVLRLDVGDTLRVFNATAGEWRARVAEKTKRGMSVSVTEFVRAARAVPDLDLLFAPVKRHATDLIVEKATELGVRRIRPVITQRTIAETVRVDRLQSIAREAAEQTERFDAPDVCEPLSLARMLDGWDASRPLIFADERGDDAHAPWGGENGRARPMLEALFPSSREEGAGGGVMRDVKGEGASPKPPSSHAQSPTPPPNPLLSRGGGAAVLVGPEGGFTPEERRMLRALAYVIPVSLGPRILRAETAVIATLSLVQAGWGDW
ncbi:ribosomal RNA small subunit methyltransferase E [alpha proteobacterium U9-1i]|nr:ribosomal RNA small subunit methyltransferase E [alpha proteobacterium U9-1i]